MLKRTIDFQQYSICGAGVGGVRHHFVTGVVRSRSSRCRAMVPDPPQRPALTTANVNNEETIAEIVSPTYPAMTGHDGVGANLVTMPHARTEGSGSVG